MSKWAGNTAFILAHVFNSASRQYYEVWASQFPFLCSLKDIIHPNEAWLYDHINWSLAQAQQHSSVGLSQSFPPMIAGKARPKTGFHFNVQKRPVPESSDASLAKRPCLESKTGAYQGGRKTYGSSVSASFTDSVKKVSWGGTAFLMCYSPQPHHHHHFSLLYRLVHLPNF